MVFELHPKSFVSNFWSAVQNCRGTKISHGMNKPYVENLGIT